MSYAEVDEAVNPANITWARVWADIRQLEEMAKTEHKTLDELCDCVFRPKLSVYHPTATTNSWEMAVSFTTPYEPENREDKNDDETGGRADASQGAAANAGGRTSAGKRKRHETESSSSESDDPIGGGDGSGDEDSPGPKRPRTSASTGRGSKGGKGPRGGRGSRGGRGTSGVGA